MYSPVSHLYPVPPYSSHCLFILLLPSFSAPPAVLMSISHSCCSSCLSLPLFLQDARSTCTAKPSNNLTFTSPGKNLCCYANTLYFLYSDGELYAGTSADFMGRDFAIFRTLGKHHPIRTEQHDSRWLNGKKNKIICPCWGQRSFFSDLCLKNKLLSKCNHLAF